MRRERGGGGGRASANEEWTAEIKRREARHGKTSHGKINKQPVVTGLRQIRNLVGSKHFKSGTTLRALRCHITGCTQRWGEEVRHSVIMDGDDPQWRRREEEVNSSEDTQKSFHLHVRQHGHRHSRLPACVLRHAQRSKLSRLSAISYRYTSDAASAIRGPSQEARRDKYAVSSRAKHHFFWTVVRGCFTASRNEKQ